MWGGDPELENNKTKYDRNSEPHHPIISQYNRDPPQRTLKCRVYTEIGKSWPDDLSKSV